MLEIELVRDATEEEKKVGKVIRKANKPAQLDRGPEDFSVENKEKQS